jgi:hypothetical protein
VELDKSLSIEELTNAMTQLKRHKIAESDGIPHKIWEEGGQKLHSELHEYSSVLRSITNF